MRLFSGIKDTFKKSEAAVVVQNLLEMQQKSGLFDSDPATSATKLIDAIWTKSPHLFDGRFGQRPHKISLAASAFANAIEVLGNTNPNSNCFAICLGNIINEVSVNGKLYPLNNLDMDLLNSAAKIFAKFSEDLAASPLGREVNRLQGRGEVGWEEWFKRYKTSAGIHNPALAPNDEGHSLIDFMEDQAIRRAHRDGVDPELLGKKFAEQFDIKKMGFR